MAEKEEAIQDLERKHKRQLIDAETKLRLVLQYSFSQSIRHTCVHIISHISAATYLI